MYISQRYGSDRCSLDGDSALVVSTAVYCVLCTFFVIVGERTSVLMRRARITRRAEDTASQRAISTETRETHARDEARPSALKL